MLISVVVAIGIAVFNIFGDALNDYLLAGKSFHTTTATVIKKQPAEESSDTWLVYYQIDSFHQLSGSTRTRLEESEKRRTAESDLRFTIRSKEWSSDLSVGSKLTISYRPTASGDIEIATIQKN